jgi:hypothetical protein
MPSPAAPASVPIGDLRPSDTEPLLLEDGGTASVEQVEYAGRRYLFKRYHPEFRAVARTAELDRLIGWGASERRRNRSPLPAIAAWPRFRVHDRDGLAGMLIVPAPDTFFHLRRPRTLDLLPDDGDGQAGDRREKLAIQLNAFGHLIEAVLWFHRHDVVINDLHAHNVLVSRFGDAVHLVDCDSMTGRHWDPVLPGNVAPDSMREVIEGVDDPCVATDFARLAHVIVSLLADEDVFEVGEPTVLQLAEMVGDPVARFLGQACRVGVFEQGSVRMWRVLGESWRARPAWATAGGVEIVEEQELWEPPFGRLLPAGFAFPRLAVGPRRPLVAPRRAALEAVRPGRLRRCLTRFGVR